MPAIRHLSPYMFLYCKSESFGELDLGWFAQHGEVQPLRNVGRESHTYMWHIVNNYDDLATHNLFHQDILEPNGFNQSDFLQRLSTFVPYTGMLALDHAAMCTCEACFYHDLPKLREIWAMTQRTFCGPTDLYPVFLKGNFLVSAIRIQRNLPQIYKTLLQYLEAPAEHWIHTEHRHDWGRDPSNPISGHIMERFWNVIFDCIYVNSMNECMELCDLATNSGCRMGGCQCFDHKLNDAVRA